MKLSWDRLPKGPIEEAAKRGLSLWPAAPCLLEKHLQAQTGGLQSCLFVLSPEPKEEGTFLSRDASFTCTPSGRRLVMGLH